jgi:propionyl-CoA synthetase
MSYQECLENWQNAPEQFWRQQADCLVWDEPYTQACQQTESGGSSWFADGMLNLCYNAVDRHVDEGRGDQTALIYDSPVTGVKARFSYTELQGEVSRLAGAMRELGVEQGDRVVIYMPMIPQAAFAMLACARLGAIHSVVFGGFSSAELAKRIDDAKPKLVMSASHGVEPSRIVEYKPLLDGALEHASHPVPHCLLWQRAGCDMAMQDGRDVDWASAVQSSTPADCVSVAGNHPLYILYTSGTTGVPKGVVRDTAGYATALNWSMDAIYGVQQGDVYWAASDIGWVVGHSYIVYGPLLAGCTTIMYEGKPVGTPDAGAFWRVIAEYDVKVLFTAPTAFRAIKQVDPDADCLKNYELSKFEALFLAGERGDPDTLNWAHNVLGCPVIDHWWQTELGWPAAANFKGLGLLPIEYGSAGAPVPGFDIVVLDEAHQQVPAGEGGDIVIRLPLAPGSFPTLWNNDEGFRRSYLEAHPGFYNTGDHGFINEQGHLYVMSRTDDIINVAGHRLSTGGIEEAVSDVSAVAECAVIGVADKLKGTVPVAFVVTYANYTGAEAELVALVVNSVRQKIGAVAALKTVVPVSRLPKTRSGKILRATMRKIADGEDFSVPATIDDPAILDEIKQALIKARK